MRRFVGGVVAAVTVVALVTGCGGGGPDAGQVVRAAATRTAAAESSRLALTVDMSGDQSGTVSGVGAFDYTARRGTMTMDLSGMPGAGGMGKVDAVFDGLVYYMKLPPELGSQLPAGASWIRFDLDELGRQAGVDLGQLMQASQGDPTQALQYLRGASDDVTEVGDEQVRGVDTTHYRATLDLRKAAASLSGSQRAALDDAIDMLGTSAIPTDVWIDSDGRARKLSYVQDLSKAHVGGTSAGVGTMKITMELFDFGVDVDATPPAADQVVDLGTLLGQPG